MTSDEYFTKYITDALSAREMCDMLAAKDIEIETLTHETTTMYYGGYREGYDDGFNGVKSL